MQATLARSLCAAAAQPAAAQRPAARVQACLHSTAALQQRRAAAGLQGAQQRRATAAAARRPRLAVAASINYGAEWSTPQDAYLTVVSGLHEWGTQALSSRLGGAGLPILPRRPPDSVVPILLAQLLSPPHPPTPPPPLPCHLCQGLSHCYAKNEDGKLADQYMIEPITANSLECMATGEWRAAPLHPCLCAVHSSACSAWWNAQQAATQAAAAASALPFLLAGGKTSFVHVFSLRLGEALARDKSAFPEEFAQVGASGWGQHVGGTNQGGQ